ncbi:ATP synthase regulation protein NCA2 domain-containing protein [Apiospora hydei]|uniref:ATP synthase regulation protein NCA2 domain-containing protein n=1 Tax=Apiospora hydei TaxID=1337664 RepID=A0ABR1WB56_9PEZI
MTVVSDQVRRLDAQLDRIPFTGAAEFTATHHASAEPSRVKDLLRIIKFLSSSANASTAAQPILPTWQVKSLLAQSQLLSEPSDEITQYETDLEWLLVSKATVQTYGIIMRTLLDQIVPLSDHIWYWDTVLSSPASSSLYMVQTSPMRLWGWSQEIYQDSKARLRRNTGQVTGLFAEEHESTWGSYMSQNWQRFYGIVRESIRERSLADIQRRAKSPFTLAQEEARQRQSRLKKLREMTASGLGVLIDEGLAFGGNGSDDGKSDIIMSNSQEWKGVVERSVALMDMVLKDVLNLDSGVADFEDRVFAGVDEDPELSIQVEDDDSNRPSVIAKRLHYLLEDQLPLHLKSAEFLVGAHGRPSRLVRYWLPATVLLFSSSTVLRILLNRQKEILDWVADLGVTVKDFWFNWIVEPTRKVIGTIRHDSNSDIAIMSRDSLKSDRDSLERMVVDFALDRPTSATGASSLSESQVADIRAKVQQGDLTPVLRAYEKDLRTPLMGAVRGDLVRTLLIQVQKTKVDVEVAMTGIDTLLRSQELVFGFVGLTPGILVSIAVFQYMHNATPSPNNLLSYKDHGLLVCELHVLRRLAFDLLPTDAYKQRFLEDLEELGNNLKGIRSQLRALDRIRWVYSKWLL